MKLLATLFVATFGVSQAFTVVPSSTNVISSSALAMDRRSLLSNAAAVAAVAVAAPLPAFAGDYVPKYDDLKQIYFLGASLDKLADKLGNPDTIEAALDGVRLFNKDPTFYSGYAKNFIQKTVKKGADSDPRVGYIKQVSMVVLCVYACVYTCWCWLLVMVYQGWSCSFQYLTPIALLLLHLHLLVVLFMEQACTLVASVETVAAGGAALADKKAIAESISRVRKAQALIAKFLAESGVKDEKVDAYIAKHK